MKNLSIALVGLLLSSTSVFAMSICGNQVIQIAGWQEVYPDDQLQCITDHPDFKSSLSYLCAPDQQTLSK